MNIFTYDMEHSVLNNHWVEEKWYEKLWEWKEVFDLNIKLFNCRNIIDLVERKKYSEFVNIVEYKIQNADIIILALDNEKSLSDNSIIKLLEQEKKMKIILSQNEIIKNVINTSEVSVFSSLEDLKEFILNYLISYE